MAGIFGDAGLLAVLCLFSNKPFACEAINTELRGLELLSDLQVLSTLLDTNSGAFGLKACCIASCVVDGLCAALCLLSSC